MSCRHVTRLHTRVKNPRRRACFAKLFSSLASHDFPVYKNRVERNSHVANQPRHTSVENPLVAAAIDYRSFQPASVERRLRGAMCPDVDEKARVHLAAIMTHAKHSPLSQSSTSAEVGNAARLFLEIARFASASPTYRPEITRAVKSCSLCSLSCCTPWSFPLLGPPSTPGAPAESWAARNARIHAGSSGITLLIPCTAP